jgi:hypothetical protein
MLTSGTACRLKRNGLFLKDRFQCGRSIVQAIDSGFSQQGFILVIPVKKFGERKQQHE